MDFLIGIFTVSLDIQKEEEGMYTCTASNQFGKQDATAFIAITGIGMLPVSDKEITANTEYTLNEN